MSRSISVNYVVKKSYTSTFDSSMKKTKLPFIPLTISTVLKVSKIQENPRDTDSTNSGKFTNVHIAIMIPVLMLLFIIMVIVLLWKNKK